MCTNGDLWTLSFSPDSGTIVTINANGTFATTVSISYTDGTSTLFTTNWTLTGARAADGTWSGTVSSATTGGTGTYATCNMTNTHPWRAAWTGD
jgi:hypothetical protein